MSHPAASIKSICSGKVYLTDTEVDDASTYRDPSFESATDFRVVGALHKGNIVNIDRTDDDYSEQSSVAVREQARSPPESDSFSVLSRNLRLMALQRAPGFQASTLYNLPNSSTNISLASTSSDYQQGMNEIEYNLDSSQPEVFVSESFSRPMSRNSTTSCLSTTATKDGIEGRRHHRYGAGPFFGQDPLSPRQEEIDAMAQPAVSLTEKMSLLNPEAARR